MCRLWVWFKFSRRSTSTSFRRTRLSGAFFGGFVIIPSCLWIIIPATWWLWLQLVRLLRRRYQQGEAAIQRAHLLALQSLQGYFCYKAICPQCKALGVAGGGSQVCEHQVHLSYCRQGSPGAKRRHPESTKARCLCWLSVTLSESVPTVVAATVRLFAGVLCSSLSRSDCMHVFTLTHRHTQARTHTHSSSQHLTCGP